MNKPRSLKLTALSGARRGRAGAAQEDPAVTALTKPQSEVSVGIGLLVEGPPAPRHLRRHEREGRLRPARRVHQQARRRDRHLDRLEGRNLGLDARDLRVDWLRQGNFGAFLCTSARRATSRTPSYGRAGHRLEHAARAFTVRDRRWARSTSARCARPGAGFSQEPGQGYDFRVTSKNEDKKGDRLWGRGGAAEFAAEPIDTTRASSRRCSPTPARRFQLQGGYYGTGYTNRNSLIDTALTTGTNPFFLSLPLDNQSHQLFANGGYSFTERTRGTFKVAYTRATQDEQIPVGPGVRSRRPRRPPRRPARHDADAGRRHPARHQRLLLARQPAQLRIRREDAAVHRGRPGLPGTASTPRRSPSRP